MIRNQQKFQTVDVLPYISLDYNPLKAEIGSSVILRGWIPEKGRLSSRQTAAPWGPPATTDSGFLDLNFRYTRAGSQESKWITVGTDGADGTGGNRWRYRLYQKSCGGQSTEIFPGNTGFAALVNVPFIWQSGNRMFFSDGTFNYVYDGRSVRRWGLTRSTTAPVVSAVAAGSLTAATGLKACITWVVLDEASNRVHESSRSNVSAFQILAAENLRVDITALSAPSGTTHWSAYVSELDGSNIYRRAATTAIGTLTVDISALPASTTPKVPIRNDPPPPSLVGCVAKNRIFIVDGANPNRFYFAALGEVEGLLNGSGPESFCGYGTNSISDIVNSDSVSDREITAMIEHENVTYLFTESKGYALVGEMNLLDSRSPRSLVKLQQFSEGCIGRRAICSTPYGLVWITPGKRILLWPGGNEIIDIGEPIQLLLDNMRSQDGSFKAATQPKDAKLHFFEGEGRQWLILNTHGMFDADNISTVPQPSTSWDMFVYDFQRPVRNKPGAWFQDQTNLQCATTIYELDGTPFLAASGYRPFANLQPLYFNETATLGKVGLGPTASFTGTSTITLRSSLIAPTGEWVVGHYLTILMGTQDNPDGTISTGTTEMYTDNEIVYGQGLGSAATITADTALTSGEVRLWFVPQASGNTNAGGSFGKRFLFEMRKSSGTSTSGNRVLFHTIYALGFTFSPMKMDAR